MRRLFAFLLVAASFCAAQSSSLPNANLLMQPPQPQAAAHCPAIDAWSTPSERRCYRSTPRYDETMAYVHRLARASGGKVRLETFGTSGAGRPLVAVIVSRDGVFSPAALHRARRPVVYMQNAIHAGEMDGKDASLALLRDILVRQTQARLIARAVLVVVPIYNADGYELFSPFHRINQNGPEKMGWRANATAQNLNRDYLKADTPETRGFLREWQRWLPDFFVDNHVTDGADYQYDVTYSLASDGPAAGWAHRTLEPELLRRVTAAGHVISPYYLNFAGATPDTGAVVDVPAPRYSHGYARIQNRPGLLVEMHMLKDYRTRVTGNYELLRALLEVINRDATRLVEANRQADRQTIARGRAHNAVEPLGWTTTEATEPFRFLGYRWDKVPSKISGQDWVRYSHEPVTMTIPLRRQVKVTAAAKIPAAYIVPAQWREVIARLALHGVQMKRLSRAWSGEVSTYRCATPSWASTPHEGRHELHWEQSEPCRVVRERLSFPAGSAVLATDQRTARVVMQWLEPLAPDSALRWGLFDTIFEQKEYGEDYVTERLARAMLQANPALQAEFDKQLAADPGFAANPQARLNWFSQRSPWGEKRVGLYPVGKLDSLRGLPLPHPRRHKKEADQDPDYDPEMPARI